MTTIPDMMELGDTGLRRYGGYIYEEFLPELSGTKATKVYKEMSSNDSTIGAILFAIDMLLRQVGWRVNPASQDQIDLYYANFIDTCTEDMSMTWEDTISEILSFLIYGWSYHELVYKIRLGKNADSSRNSRFNDGKIGWRKIPIRSQDSLYEWKFDQAGGLEGMWQTAFDFTKRYIPMEKALLFRTALRKNNPEGVSVLRTAYRSWYFKKNMENLEGIGVERDLAGLPVAEVPPELLNPNAPPAQKSILSQIKQILRNVRRDEQEGVIFPKAYDENGKDLYNFKLLNTGGSRQLDTDKIINRYDQRIAMSVMADFMLLGSQKTGSYALSSDKTDLFTTALTTWLDSIAATFNRYAIPRLFELNGFPTEKLPTLVHDDVRAVNLVELGDFITKLAGAGMPLFPDDELEKYVRQQGKLPQRKEL